jgi:hypothetical protein
VSAIFFTGSEKIRRIPHKTMVMHGALVSRLALTVSVRVVVCCACMLLIIAVIYVMSAFNLLIQEMGTK